MPTTSHQALYRRFRSQRFSEVIAQDAVVETLRNAVRLDRLSHGLLFVGPRGTGKTSMARIVAKAVNCANPVDGEPDDTCEACAAIREGRALDVVELDAASNNRVDDMRELLPRVYTAPSDLRRKVFIIDEVQRIKEGWDVLLKTLEEPPDDVFFIFCTTDPSGIRPAVISRLQRYTFRPLPVAQIESKLRRIVEAEGRAVTDDALTLLAERAAGGMRDAESMLDQVLSAGAENVDADTVRDLLGLADQRAVETFVTALAGGDALAGIAVLDGIEAEGRDLVAFADQVVERLRRDLVAALGGGAATAGMARQLAAAAHRLAVLDTNRAAAGGYRLQLELALLESAAESAPLPIDRPMASPAVKPTPRPDKATTTAPAKPAARPDAQADLLEQLQAAWPQVVERVGANPANRPLINACRPVEVDDGTVVLGFPESQGFLRDIAERKRPALEEGLSAVLGRSVVVRLVAANVEVGAPIAASEDLVDAARRVFAEDLVEVGEVE